MDLPLVSVIVPVYNSEKYLKHAMESILSQSYKHIELIIIDDGSTDSSRQIIMSYSDPRVRLIENEENKGIVYSRNRGIDEARGAYIANLDSDDIALPGRIEKQVNFLNANPDYGMCGTFFYKIDQERKRIESARYPTDNRNILTALILGNCFGTSSVMIRAELAREMKFREEYFIGEDYELWYRVSKRAKLANLPFYGVLYRIHGDNITLKKMNEMLEILKKINRRILSDMNLSFSEDELEIHSNFLCRNLVFFEDPAHFNGLEGWIIKLYEALQNRKEYNRELFFELIAERWIVTAFNTGSYKKLVRNRLLRFNKAKYMKCLCKRVFNKVAIRRRRRINIQSRAYELNLPL